ncbi:hypothetical protein BT93_F1257 [Corymbia citriodora subsp. variegata]|nr:hypothetical protein BT93_F1257 [Corymbia citriodora subsp. variegata]
MQSKEALFIMEKFIFLAFLDVLLASLLMFQPTICSSNFTDQDALLRFKSMIEVDPTNTIKGGNWTVEANFCEWMGVVCSKRSQRVTALNLSSMGLQGILSPSLGNLSLLISLDLRNNNFYGTIVTEIARLRRLKKLILQWNQFEGNIPPSLARCRNLEVLPLAANRLTGGIPREFGTFPKLQRLALSFNPLGGQIPSSWFISLDMNNLTGSIPLTLFNRSLTIVDLSYNDLSGSMPCDLCYCWPNIQRLLLSHNQFNGLLLETLTQCKELLVLFLGSNHLQGSIPRDIDSLQKLQKLYLYDNNLIGMIPRTIGNMSSMQMLVVGKNHIRGDIPSEIGNLVNLNILGRQDNLLTGVVPQEVFNISSLQELSLTSNSLSGSLPSGSALSLPNLKELFLANNSFSGSIPQYFLNCSKLTLFDVGYNQLSGPIPTSLGNLKNLRIFDIESNKLTGETYGAELGFLHTLSNCQSLQTMFLGNNPLGGSIPASIKNFSSSLQILAAPHCQIRGHIPKEMGFLKGLTFLTLSNNDLVGNITSSIGLEKGQRLYLDNNHLKGTIPDQICNLTSLGELLLQQNRISGSIPNCIGNLSSLQKFLVSSNNMTSFILVSLWSLQELIFLNLSLNSFNGALSFDMGKMTVIESIDLSWNQLTGAIPSSIQELEGLASLNLSRTHFKDRYRNQSVTLKGLRYLHNLNLSFNKLSGEVPNGGPFGNFSAFLFMGNEGLCGNAIFHIPPCKVNERNHQETSSYAILLVIVICLLRKHNNTAKKAPVLVDNPPAINHPRISYQELCSATNNFNESNSLGAGTFSSVYKGTLANGIAVAVKVLNLHIEGAMKSFDTECEVFRKIRHRNLVKVISTCTNVDMRALVLQYIMVDVAMGIEYLHHSQSELIVHCNLKPSNVLLNEDLTAQILAESKLKTQTRTLGTIGYIPPEYGLEGKVSTKGDVYSSGILLLEVITKKKPIDEMFDADMSLKQWVSVVIPTKVLDIMDSELLTRKHENLMLSELESIVLSILELRLECLKELPEERIDMKTVVVKLNKIKLSLP